MSVIVWVSVPTVSKPAQHSDATRWTLLARLRNWGDDESWREFLDAYWGLIYAVALKSGLSDAEAQDVVQDTLLSVAKGIHRFRCDPAAGSFKAWLLKLTRWRILNQLRKRLPGQAGASHLPAASGSQSEDDSVRTSTVDRLPDQASLDLDAVWETEWERSLAEAAKQAIQQRVSARQFQIFELSVVQGWPVREVARVLGISAGQVYLARHRVTRLLKKEQIRLRSRTAQGGLLF